MPGLLQSRPDCLTGPFRPDHQSNQVAYLMNFDTASEAIDGEDVVEYLRDGGLAGPTVLDASASIHG